jgi:hypothetical protein
MAKKLFILNFIAAGGLNTICKQTCRFSLSARRKQTRTKLSVLVGVQSRVSQLLWRAFSLTCVEICIFVRCFVEERRGGAH